MNEWVNKWVRVVKVVVLDEVFETPVAQEAQKAQVGEVAQALKTCKQRHSISTSKQAAR